MFSVRSIQYGYVLNFLLRGKLRYSPKPLKEESWYSLSEIEKCCTRWSKGILSNVPEVLSRILCSHFCCDGLKGLQLTLLLLGAH